MTECKACGHSFVVTPAIKPVGARLAALDGGDLGRGSGPAPFKSQFCPSCGNKID